MNMQFVRIGKYTINLAQVSFVEDGTTYKDAPVMKVYFNAQFDSDIFSIYLMGEDYEVAKKFFDSIAIVAGQEE